MKRIAAVAFTAFASILGLACSDASTGTSADGQGTVTFTTYGEDFIEKEIGPGGTEDAPVVDGWTITYEKFYVALGEVSIGDDGRPASYSMPNAKIFNMKMPGQKPVMTFANVPGKPYTHVSYAIAPATAAAELGEGATDADKQMMVSGGYSIYVEGKLTKDAVTKTFAWGFKTNTLYDRCKGELAGKETDGVVVTNGGTDAVELTMHGDHFFYDDLQAAEAKVRVGNIADADADNDGKVTLEELAAVQLAAIPKDKGTYGVGSSANVNDLRSFVEALSRTVGHFRGEGECFAKAR